jgi:quinohemoprotein ethanol dehydrogenase
MISTSKRLVALIGRARAGACAANSIVPRPADRLAVPAAGEWPSDGRDYTAQRYSPLTQIDASNVAQLGLAWYDDLDTYRGVEATPIYADGVLYNTLAWNITTAYDARTGRRLWTYDPQVPREFGRYACCEPVARGLAMHGDKIIIATLDGRLIALDKATGQADLDHPDLRPRDALFDHRRAAGVRRQGRGRPVGRRPRRARVRCRLRRQHRRKLWKFFLTPTIPAKGPDGEASDPVMD